MKSLNDKWAECFARLEAIILAKSFAVPVEPFLKSTEVITSEKPFFDPGAGTSQMSTGGVSDVIVTGSSPVQATGEVAVNMEATQPVEAPGTRKGDVINKNATQPVEAPCASSDVQFQPTDTTCGDGSAVDRSLTCTRTVAENTGVSDSEDEMASAPESPAAESDRNFVRQGPSQGRQIAPGTF